MRPTLAQAKEILSDRVKERYLKDHALESAAVMKALAIHFGEDAELWQVAGLLHDLDWEETADHCKDHGIESCEELKRLGFDDPVLFQAIKSHNGIHNGVKKSSRLDICLSAAENTTGLIYAYILMRPEKNLDGVEAKSILKKYKNKAFAAKVDREAIAEIESLGLSLAEFFNLTLDAFRGIMDQIEIK